MKCFIGIVLSALLLSQFQVQIDGGPAAGATCCAGCCATAMAVPFLGAAGFGACLPTCIATLGGFPPHCGGALELALAFINTNANALGISIKSNPNALALLALELINA
ncbi:unnamed protein product [Rotaria sp. Silwood2]|nr:unnamed protein product [Rotaria sp. Silwood2]CAF4135824.1 unnamed protein product [Rotaria sp. Silwood2]